MSNKILENKNYLIDMDGVLVHGRTPIPGAGPVYSSGCRQRNVNFLVLTNNPLYTPGDLAHRLNLAGLEIPAERIFTSAMATAQFLLAQKPGGDRFRDRRERADVGAAQQRLRHHRR